ncbi:hypothetical protein P7K49_005510 [Saguinus oedipus]|uniref:Uncharacterized protein n=1 Tax=Saguinus oedipus TaxID=9490 RepID=A0ABQ9W0L1_SAGOE|nr:hypothetical protein P7K49_005510 [Saguinus oedipus]
MDGASNEDSTSPCLCSVTLLSPRAGVRLALQLLDTRQTFGRAESSSMCWKGPVEETKVPHPTDSTDCQRSSEAALDPLLLQAVSQDIDFSIHYDVH